MSCNVFTGEYIGTARNHVAIIIEKESDKTCHKYHVVGTVLMGMTYETRPDERPDESPTYVDGTQRLIGRIRETDIPRFEEICEAVPPPGPQLKLNGQPIDPTKLVRRCSDWVREVMEKVLAEDIVTP